MHNPGKLIITNKQNIFPTPNNTTLLPSFFLSNPERNTMCLIFWTKENKGSATTVQIFATQFV